MSEFKSFFVFFSFFFYVTGMPEYLKHMAWKARGEVESSKFKLSPGEVFTLFQCLGRVNG